MKVLISGATGLIGSALAERLARDHQVTRLTRRPSRNGDVGWDPALGVLEPAALEGQDAVVHLAGESIARLPWNGEHKRRVRESRVGGTRLLSAALATLEHPPPVLVSGSAMGIYGDRGDEPLTEQSTPGTGFLAEVAGEWESATRAASDRGIRVVHLRTGHVLAPRGGLLGPLARIGRLGLGGPLGSGRQWMSWIAIDDEVGAILHCIARADLEGPVNAVAPQAVRQREFAGTLGRVLGRPAVLPAPAFALRLLLGREAADDLLLAGQRVEPRRLTETGYPFRFPSLEPALRHVLGRA